MAGSCTTKLRFATRDGAAMAAKLHGEQHNKPTRAYYCARRLCWHLTAHPAAGVKPITSE